MGWLRLVGSIKLQVPSAKEPCKRDYVLQKRPMIFSLPTHRGHPIYRHHRSCVGSHDTLRKIGDVTLPLPHDAACSRVLEYRRSHIERANTLHEISGVAPCFAGMHTPSRCVGCGKIEMPSSQIIVHGVFLKSSGCRTRQVEASKWVVRIKK